MAEHGNGGIIPPHLAIHNTGDGEPECYIPLKRDPERTERTMAIWREAGERLGLIPRPDPEADEDA